MRTGGPPIHCEDVRGEEQLGHARRLFWAFADAWDPLVAAIFDAQGFEAELAGLPGHYAPRWGACCWRPRAASR